MIRERRKKENGGGEEEGDGNSKVLENTKMNRKKRESESVGQKINNEEKGLES